MSKLIDSVLTLGKVALLSRHVGRTERETPDGPLIIMGNGPSLRETISGHLDTLLATDTMAVNFAANAPEYRKLRPDRYILADPHFFKGAASDPNVRQLWDNLRSTDWPLTLHLPARADREGALAAGFSSDVKVSRFNMTPGEGYDFLTHPLYSHALAMPRPRNVLVPAIMEGIRAGYREIFLAGADHTWPHTLFVDDRNRVVSVQPHFYEDNKKELDRVAEEYAGRRLHDVMESMVVAFRSYHHIRRYAEKRGVRIINVTPGSLIDAFERGSL